MSLDTVAARELELYVENDSQLYHSQHVPILKNLALKKVKGVYSEPLAIKLWMYLMDAGAKKYCKEMGGGEWNRVFSVETRRAAAKTFNDNFVMEYDLGNYHRLLPKKYQ